MSIDEPRFTLISFHAHPDDESLLTAGTLAKAVADGHRVVLVMATSGEAGLTDGPSDPEALARRRREELRASAAAIGVARVEVLGYPDSGSDTPRVVDRSSRARPAFADMDPRVPAGDLHQILVEEGADVLTIYDAAGGYGHPDHVQVHHVGLLAARSAGTPVVLEATVDREVIGRAVRALRRLGRIVPMPELPDLAGAYCAPEDLTHRVDVRPHLVAKVGSLRAHTSQSTGGPRTLALILRLPRPLRRRVLGTEWFREVGRPPTGVLVGDIFDTLRRQPDKRIRPGHSPAM